MNKYQYQFDKANEVVENINSNLYEAVVLAAAPSAGKSTIIIDILNKILSNEQVIVLTHNQTNLIDQMIESFDQGFIQPKFSYGSFRDQAQVKVGIPSNAKDIESCDVLVVDEAHQYFFASMVQGIIQKFQPKIVILMTGTPSVFNQINKENIYPKYGMTYVSGDELAQRDIYSKVIVDVVVKGDDIVETYKNALRSANQDNRFDDSKLMIACKSIQEACTLGAYLNSIDRKAGVSTSQDDNENTTIKKFKNNELDTLIVVNRGVLGFSDNNITALFDFKNSKSIDNRFQLLARVFRKHPNNIDKFYVSASSMGNMDKELQVIYDTVELMSNENFTK